MKTINKYIAVGAVMLATLTSCGNDWLDLEPSTSTLTETSINNMQDCYASLNGIYSTMQNAYAYSGRMVYYGDATGDDMQAYSATKRTGDAYLLSYTKNTVKESYWSYPYSMIGACNNILAQIGNLSANTSDKETLDFYTGQAYALRAMFLFDLTKFFGYPYKKDNGASLGVPVVTEMLDKSAKPSRNTVAEDYKQIIEDLVKACELMNTATGKKFVKGKMNRFAALTLLSRVYLYHGDDDKALEAAETAITEALKAKYHLWTNAEYATAWAADCSASDPGETLLEVINLTEDSPGKEALGYLHRGRGYKDIICTSSFYDMLTKDKNDVRTKLLTVASKRAYCNKFQPQENELIQDANIRLIRLSETYLNAAEAAVKTGDDTKAAYYLNAIVNRANPANSVQSGVTLEQVMTERRKELFGEGHRMFDALRDGGKVVRKNVSVSAISSTKHLTMTDDKKEFDWNYFRCILPIPISETDANNNIKQNPDY